MVCLGNISRSPLAEGVFKSKSFSTHFHIDSVATANFHIMKSPDHGSIIVTADHGIDIILQKARSFKLEDFKLFDKIYVMDRNNLKTIIQLAETAEQFNKVSLILGNEDVPDPYYGDENDFKIVFELLSKACEKIKFDLINYKNAC